MPSSLRRLFQFLNRDLTGKTWERECSHPYFGTVVYFGADDEGKCYWEAELRLADLSRPFSVTMRGTPNGPEQTEQVFCEALLADLDGLFLKCRDPFQREYATLTDRAFPSNWRAGFALDGLQIPLHGDGSRPWDVCYFAESVGRYFTAEFNDGQIVKVTVDG
jgi:hypothetical protein